MKVAEPEIRFGPRHNRCPYCHEAVQPTDVKAACNGCMAWQHEACWTETRQVCASCGQEQIAPAVQEEAEGPGLLLRQWRRFDKVLLIAVNVWLLAGALIGAVVGAWSGAPVWASATGGAILGALLGVVGGLWLIPEDEEATVTVRETGER